MARSSGGTLPHLMGIGCAFDVRKRPRKHTINRVDKRLIHGSCIVKLCCVEFKLRMMGNQSIVGSL